MKTLMMLIRYCLKIVMIYKKYSNLNSILSFMMVAGPQINRLNNKMLNKIIEFMQKIKEAELLNVIGLSLYS